MSELLVTRAGPLTTVQDLGRPGLAHLAVSRSGAADAASLRLANRLVGNPEGAAGLETTLLGAAVRLRSAAGSGRWVAVTGADCEVRVDGRPADVNHPVYLPAGAEIDLGAATRGLRSYLAVAGGVLVAPVLGSRSRDTLNGLGPAPLGEDDELPLGEPGRPAHADAVPGVPLAGAVGVRITPGPRHGWFTDESLALLVGAPYEVTGDSDRVGARLTGPVLERVSEQALPSEGIVLGAVQVPDNGQPLVFLADHPTTGGYPVVGVVHPRDLPAVAQARPGTSIRFRWSPLGWGRGDRGAGVLRDRGRTARGGGHDAAARRERQA
jgi:biotin-dependent carboxylase-like uncharacterized protein